MAKHSSAVEGCMSLKITFEKYENEWNFDVAEIREVLNG